MRTLFIAAGPITWGSSRMRVYWPARHIAGAEVGTYEYITKTRDFSATYDVMIWQKLVSLEIAKAYPRTRHYLDVCDPAWWWQPDAFREAAPLMAGIVASSEALAADCAEFLGGRAVHTIPDRLDLAHFDRQAQHVKRSPVRLIWFGVAVNRWALLSTMPNLERLAANGHRIELTICDDRPDEAVQWTDEFPIYHTRWSLGQEVATLTAHDIALLPPYPGPWGRVKSENKTITAGACGLPIWDGQSYQVGERLVSNAHFREAMGVGGRRNAETNYRAEQSAADWERLLNA